jgi:hypothetical protein
VFSFLYIHPHFKNQDFILFKNQSVQYHLKAENRKIINAINGRWEGIFDETRAVLQMNANDSLCITGSLSVYYNKMVNQGFKGNYDKVNNQVILNDTIDKLFKGSYKFTIIPDSISGRSGHKKYNAEGSWKSIKLKPVKFKFTKTTK